MNLNIGSNTVKIKGFHNVDIRPADGVDIVDDARTLKTIEPDSCEAIIARHILEHFPYDETQTILNRWVSKLVPGGWIEISVPNLPLICLRCLLWIPARRQYIGKPWEELNHAVFGNMKEMRQWHGNNEVAKYMHHAVFSRGYLRKLMRKSGLKKVKSKRRTHRDCFTLRGYKPIYTTKPEGENHEKRMV